MRIKRGNGMRASSRKLLARLCSCIGGMTRAVAHRAAMRHYSAYEKGACLPRNVSGDNVAAKLTRRLSNNEPRGNRRRAARKAPRVA